MKISDRIERDRQIIAFLTTPLKDAQEHDLLDKKGHLVYPSHRKASEKWGLDKGQISRIKKQWLALYELWMSKNENDPKVGG